MIYIIINHKLLLKENIAINNPSIMKYMKYSVIKGHEGGEPAEKGNALFQIRLQIQSLSLGNRRDGGIELDCVHIFFKICGFWFGLGRMFNI